MTMIFSASGEALSFDRSSRFLGPLIQWLMPWLSVEGRHTVMVLIRKGGHVSEYAVLALLSYRALRATVSHPPGWYWRIAAGAVVIVIVYAISDEWHQAHVPNRQGAVADVVLDTIGGLLGLTLLFIWRRRFAEK
jgi:VanZ family protein